MGRLFKWVFYVAVVDPTRPNLGIGRIVSGIGSADFS